MQYSDIRVAAAYIRVSTEEQAEYSPDSQLREIRNYAKSHHLIVPDTLVFTDEGISGKTTEKRPEFNRMIGTAKTKPRPFDVLLLWKFSRFARNRQDSIVYKSMLRRELGIEVVSVTEPMSDDKTSIIMEAIIEAMDEYYSINLAEEVRRGMQQRARTGKPNTYAPFGYHMVEGGLYELDAEQAPIVEKIFHDFLDGKGFLQIAKEMNALGLRTRFGNPFENRTVEYILRNPVYIGKVRWTPTGKVKRNAETTDTLIIDGTHTPIITPEIYEAVQQKIAVQKKKYARHARTDGEPFMLKGIVKCSCCGATLTRLFQKKTPKGGPSVQCYQYAHGRCPESHCIQISILTKCVLERIENDFMTLDFEVLSLQKEAADSNADMNFINRQIAKETQKLARVKEAYAAGIDTLEEYKQNKQAITERIKQLELQQPVPAEQITAAQFAILHRKDLEQLKDETIDEPRKNDILRGWVQKIVFDRKNTNFKIYYYN